MGLHSEIRGGVVGLSWLLVLSRTLKLVVALVFRYCPWVRGDNDGYEHKALLVVVKAIVVNRGRVDFTVLVIVIYIY